jgi:hypothetical protein
MNYNIVLRSLKVLLFLSFFLPFFYACDKEESQSNKTESQQIQADSASKGDSATIAASASGDTIKREEKKSILQKTWNEITMPDYGNGMAFTGFGYFLIAIQCMVDSGDETATKINCFIFTLLFLSVVVLVFLPKKRKKLHLILSGWNFAVIVFYLGMETIEDHLYGYWLALLLSFLILMMQVLEKRLQLLWDEETGIKG